MTESTKTEHRVVDLRLQPEVLATCACGQVFDSYGSKGAMNKLTDHAREMAEERPAITVAKQGYLVAITNEDLENAQVWPVKLLSPEEQAAQRAAVRERSRAYVAGITARLATAHPALHPVIELHSPDQYLSCTGCDEGSYAEDSPAWPCRTIDLILEGL